MLHRWVSIRNRGDAYFGTLVFGHFEHKIEVFVLFCPPQPQFSGISSTKSGFLCAFGLRNPHFRHFRAQNRHFCALWWGHGRGDGRELREQREQREQRGRWPGATGTTGTTGATVATGATGTTAGTVWVADILSQLGFVWTLALYLTWLVVSSDISPGA